jgi:hypothetical protein
MIKLDKASVTKILVPRLKLYFQIFIILIFCLLAKKYLRDSRMSDNWTAPNYSASANLLFGQDLSIDLEEIKFFKNLSIDDQDAYIFSKSDNLIPGNRIVSGFPYILKLSKTLFFFLGDQDALIMFQILIYLIVNILIFDIFKKISHSLFFLIFFSLNPIVLKFVVFNYLYFWQIIPSALLLYLYYMKNRLINDRSTIICYLLILLLPFVFLTRPTTIATIFLIGIISFKYYDFKRVMISFLYFISIFHLIPQPVNAGAFFHTTYVGLGAYPNEHQNYLSDKAGYELYEEIHGERIVATRGGNLYESVITDRYNSTTKKEYIRIMSDDPFLVLKHAVLNTLIGYTYGYMNVNLKEINYISAFLGLLLVIFLIISKNYFLFLAIGATLCTYTLYYPPIPSYMFGAYILNVFSFLKIIEYLKPLILKKITN